MTDQIDGPMLMGIAALVTSMVNLATTLQNQRRTTTPKPPRRPRKRRGGLGRAS